MKQVGRKGRGRENRKDRLRIDDFLRREVEWNPGSYIELLLKGGRGKREVPAAARIKEPTPSLQPPGTRQQESFPSAGYYVRYQTLVLGAMCFPSHLKRLRAGCRGRRW